jgi:hypothetical protein
VPDVLEVGGESAAAKVGPRLWRKHLLRWGEWVHPNDSDKKLKITPEFAAKLKANFDAAILDTVPVPGKHTDDWKANHGDVVGLEVHPEKGVYALLKVDQEADEAIAAGKLKGVSGGLVEDYLDKERNVRVGPVLRHISLTNVPYIKHLEGFEAVAALSDDETLVVLSEVQTPAPPKEDTVTKEEALAFLKGEGIDVEALQGEAGSLKTLREALKGASIELAEDAKPEQIIAALSQLKTKADESTSLSERVVKLEADRKREQAERLVAPYIKVGKVVPADKDKWIALAETNPEMCELALKGMSENVLLGELGTADPGEDPNKPTDLTDPAKVDEEVARYAKLAKDQGLRVKAGATA